MKNVTLKLKNWFSSLRGEQVTNVAKVAVHTLPLSQRINEDELQYLLQLFQQMTEQGTPITLDTLRQQYGEAKAEEVSAAASAPVSDSVPSSKGSSLKGISSKEMFSKEMPPKEVLSKGTSSKRIPLMTRVVSQLLLFMSKRYQLRYNELTRLTEIGRVENEQVVYTTITDRDYNSICRSAQLEGVECFPKDVKSCIESDFVPSFHPFTHYFEHLPVWDGVDRVQLLAQRISHDALWNQVFHIWMLGMVAQWMRFPKQGAKHANALAPILISTEQGLGKSTFCRMLLPEELANYYTDSFDVNAESSCERKMACCGLINMDEFDSIPRDKVPTLKKLMQRATIRLKHGNSNKTQVYNRLASYIGTTNRRDVLVDSTGSRRFYCVEVEGVIDCDTPIEYEQLYAQLKAELEQGAQYWLEGDLQAKVQQHNKSYYRMSPEEELLLTHFRFVSADVEGAQLLPANRIFEKLKRIHPSVMRGANVNTFYKLLPNYQQAIHKTYGNFYRVVEME
jgi:hypothetical protein